MSRIAKLISFLRRAMSKAPRAPDLIRGLLAKGGGPGSSPGRAGRWLTYALMTPLALLTSGAAAVAQSLEAQLMERGLPARDACTPIYAVHKNGCLMEKFFTCQQAGQVMIRNEQFYENGLFYIDFTDEHGNTIQAWALHDENNVVGIAENRQLISQPDLQQDGQDRFDITRLKSHPWFADPLPEVFQAEIRLTGERLELDGVTFAQAELRGYTKLNAYKSDFRRFYYFDFETGAFPGGGDIEENEASHKKDDSGPVKVIFPDDPAFQIDQPQYGCGTLSRLAPRSRLRAKG